MKRTKKPPRVPGTYTRPSCAHCMREATKLLVREGFAHRDAQEIARKRTQMRAVGLDFRCTICNEKLGDQIREKLAIWVRKEAAQRASRAARRVERG